MKKAIFFLLLAACAWVGFQMYNATDWRTYESTAGGFTASFPAPPNESVEVLRVPGEPIEAHKLSIGLKQEILGIKVRDRIYQVAYFDVPGPPDLEGLMENPPGQELFGTDRKLKVALNVTQGGVAGRESRSESKEYMITTRAFAVGRRVYLSSTSHGRFDMAPDDSERFLDSLQMAGGERRE